MTRTGRTDQTDGQTGNRKEPHHNSIKCRSSAFGTLRSSIVHRACAARSLFEMVTKPHITAEEATSTEAKRHKKEHTGHEGMNGSPRLMIDSQQHESLSG
jgi:hypothetical protein